MPFCYSPWTNIDIDPAGNITPCCKFQTQYYQRTYNIQQNSITDYLDSDMLRSAKIKFEQGQWPIGCERCRIEEENQIASKRQLDWNRWQDAYKQQDLTKDNFITASVAFGNTCNLKCITCSSYSSSRWQQEYREIYDVFWPHVKFYKQDFVERFTELAPGLIHLDIPGGEPFLSGVEEQKSLLQHYVDSGQSKQITLHYTTNATIFPDESWWQLWTNFKAIDLQLSIDGTKQRYEYIRYPANWDQTVDNVQRYLEQSQCKSNFMLSVSHTVSAYNIYYLDDFFSWCYNIGLPRPWLGRLHSPPHMRSTVWPEHVRNIIIDKLNASHDKDVKLWATLMSNQDDSRYFDMFVKRLQQHDQYRKLNFSQTFPELAEYI